jgi:hypothetical protein
MNCADCGQPIRPTGQHDGIGRYDGRYEFEYVHDDGNPICDGTFAARPRTSRLTDDDRFLIAEARRIGPALQARISDQERLAGEVIDRLADLAERLDSRPA